MKLTIPALAVAALLGLPAASWGSTLHVSPTGNDVNACTSVDPCRTLDRAYQAASRGDTVLVAAGSYGTQYVQWDANKSSGTGVVRIEAAPGATPVFHRLGTEASFISFVGPFQSGSLETNGDGHQIEEVSVEDVTVDGALDERTLGYVANANGVTWTDVSIGGGTERTLVVVDGGVGDGLENVVFDRVHFHDVYTEHGSAAHVECLGAWGGWNVTIRNSHFSDCTTMDLFVSASTATGVDTHTPKSWVIENNVFEPPHNSGIPPDTEGFGVYTVGFREGAPIDGHTFRNNTVNGTVSFAADVEGAPSRVVGNIMVSVNCRSELTYSHNVTASAACSGTGNAQETETAIHAGFRDPDNHDFHLEPSSPAIDKGDQSDHTATDIDGDARPATAPDAGADELVYRYVTPSGSGTACTESAPCGSFSAAYAAAPPRAVVKIAAGTYGNQTLPALTKPSSEPVLFVPASGAVTIGDLEISADHVEVRGVATDGWAVVDDATDVVLRDVDAVGGTGGYVAGASNVRILGGEIAGMSGTGLLLAHDGTDARDVVVDGLTIRDLGNGAKCIHAASADGLEIRNVKLVDCGTDGVFLSPHIGVVEDVTIENSWIAAPQAGTYAVTIGGAAVRVALRHNSLTGPVDLVSANTGAVLSGNIIAGVGSYGCSLLVARAQTFAYNMTETACTATGHEPNPDLLDDFVEASASGFDLHLEQGAAAIEAAEGEGGYPTRDIDGDTRPQHAHPDMGADEVADESVYVSTTGSGTLCTFTQKCGSFAAAYNAARPGWTVRVAAGTYASQTLTSLPGKASAEKVRFVPDGGTVTVAGITIDDTDNVEFADMVTTGWGVVGGADDVILRDVTATSSAGSGGYVNGASDLEVIGGEIGGFSSYPGILLDGSSNTRVTIDRVFVHDLGSSQRCVSVSAATDLEIRSSRFVNCGDRGISVHRTSSAVVDDVTLENNWIGGANYSLWVGDAGDVLVRHNSFIDRAYLNGGSTSTTSFVGNILGGFDAGNSFGCLVLSGTAAAFHHNLTEAPCTGSDPAHDHVVDAGLLADFVDASTTTSSAFDLHLVSGAAAIGMGHASDHPVDDFDGDARPLGAGVDIGADERL